MKLFRLTAAKTLGTSIQNWRLIVWGDDEAKARAAAVGHTGESVWADPVLCGCVELAGRAGVIDIQVSR